ncbi:hypothetical protein RvY_00766 [Ramazzottius varieornatus]|uniref:Uncharacterized protein n=1 Tax=Ramazzottius varieornatus TaxID=947166 RepID=A0A1D1UET9_RAMVA|nr:hypothetical protein RvY_00766 [Ramazzottius varieornatus]
MDGDIVTMINDMPAVGLPLACVNDILLPEDFPSDLIVFELLSIQHSPVATTSGNPTELADYLKLDCKRERDAQGDVRHYAYCM